MQLNYILRISSILFFILLVQKSHAFDSLRMEKDQGKYYVVHRVEQGETLYSLTRRYGVELKSVVEANGIVGNQISLDQQLRIPIDRKLAKRVQAEAPEERSGTTEGSKTHLVVKGETLYAISRKYGVSTDALKEWNGLSSSEISIGQLLVVSPSGKVEDYEELAPVQPIEAKPEVPPGFSVYYVQSGDLLESIAGRFKVKPDSIVIWNELPNTYLSIGQKLLVRGRLDSEILSTAEKVEVLSYGTRKQVKDQSGFVKIYEEGTARKIEEVVETQKYLALHRTLPVGALIEVRNLMNNQKIFVRVVGKLPETGLNENVMVRLTPVCFERLGVIDPKTRVEVSYYLD